MEYLENKLFFGGFELYLTFSWQIFTWSINLAFAIHRANRSFATPHQAHLTFRLSETEPLMNSFNMSKVSNFYSYIPVGVGDDLVTVL
jgi:hypothetical protein